MPEKTKNFAFQSKPDDNIIFQGRPNTEERSKQFIEAPINFPKGGRPSKGIYETAAGTMAPISDFAPLIQSGRQGRVMLLMCNVGHDPAADQTLSNSTGRSITAFTDFVGASNYTQVGAFTGNTTTHIAPRTVFNPQYFSPYLNLTPNVAAPGAAAVSGAQNQ